MDNIRMKRDDLLDALRKNRSKHETDFIEAEKVWIKKATKALRKAAKQAEDGGEIDTQPLKDLPKPKSYLSAYDDALARVERDVRDELELDDITFSAWVQDNWNWRGQFAANASLYR